MLTINKPQDNLQILFQKVRQFAALHHKNLETPHLQRDYRVFLFYNLRVKKTRNSFGKSIFTNSLVVRTFSKLQ